MNLALATVLTGMIQVPTANALDLRRGAARWDDGVAEPRQANGNGTVSLAPAPAASVHTFRGFYDSHATGRGIWKWSNALVAYQRHFGAFVGHAVDLAEVGVQSGGSLLMWQEVLGPGCHVFGLDVNPQCLRFQDKHTTITIGDQSDASMWARFFDYTAMALDILVDDGGHEPYQMLVTLTEVFPKLSPGGFISIEDIHGLSYVDSFLKKAATYIGQEHHHGRVASVHVYPFVLIVSKVGVSTKLPPSELSFAGPSTTVDSFEAMWPALQTHKGGHVVLQNAGWGTFLTEQGLVNFFGLFGSLHEAAWSDLPPGCATTSSPVCTSTVSNSQIQGLITGVHVYPTYLVVEVAAAPPVISAVRRGSDWIAYA